ncbi:MAG: hypothetical protein Q4A78_12205 [Peptostreptococcaceae bacterium]|nr:hypothetical protein [Peptostreptococcaceae bacterium]
MNKTYRKLVEEARKKKLKETVKCKKELAKLYAAAYKDIAGTIHATNPNIWAVQYQEELRKRIEKLNPALLKSIQGYIQNAASYGVAPEQGLFMNIPGAKAHEIMANLAKIPEKVAQELIAGKFYQDGAGLSARIWNYSKQDRKGVDYIIRQGLLQKKSTLELAKDLETYLHPSAKKDFQWRRVYPNAGNKTIDFNAFRLASTSITHAYQLATIRAAKENPFADGIKWHSALSTRTCELCRSRHGQVFKMDEVPLDHPLGLCTTYSVITKSMEEIGAALGQMARGSDRPPSNEPEKQKVSEQEKKHEPGRPYYDNSKKWRIVDSKGAKRVSDLLEYEVDSVLHKVDGHHVILDYGENEKRVAELIAKKYGKEVKMVPRINYPKNIKTPDYLIENVSYDLKTPTGQGKNALYDMVRRSKGQADSFVIDVSNSKISTDKIVDQVNLIYSSKHTRFVDEVVIMRDNKIIGSYKKR